MTQTTTQLDQQPLSSSLSQVIDDIATGLAEGIITDSLAAGGTGLTVDPFVPVTADLLPAVYDTSLLPPEWEIVQEINYEAANFESAAAGEGGFNAILVRNVASAGGVDPYGAYALVIRGAEVSPPDTSLADIATASTGAESQFQHAIENGLLDVILREVDLSGPSVERFLVVGQSQGHALMQLVLPQLALAYRDRYSNNPDVIMQDALGKLGGYGYAGYGNADAARRAFGDDLDILDQYSIEVANILHAEDPTFLFEIGNALINGTPMFDYVGGSLGITFTDEINVHPDQVPGVVKALDEALGGLIDIVGLYNAHSAAGYASMVLNDPISILSMAITREPPEAIFEVPTGYDVTAHLPSPAELLTIGEAALEAGIGSLLDAAAGLLGGEAEPSVPVEEMSLEIETQSFIDPVPKDTSPETAIQRSGPESTLDNFGWQNGQVAKGIKLQSDILNEPGQINQTQAAIVSDDYRPGAAKLSPGEQPFGPDNALLEGLYKPDPRSEPPIPDADWSLVKNKQYFGSEFSNTITGKDATLFIDPLIVDLDGNGVSTSSFAEKLVFFDIDNDQAGYEERTGWVGAQDGMVVSDLNQNGVIDGIREVASPFFGNAQGDGSFTFDNAYESLKQFDSDGNTELSAAEAEAAGLFIWVDANSDGVSDSGELKTLNDVGLTALSLSYVGANGAVNNGNEILGFSKAYRSGGGETDTQAVMFLADPRGHRFTEIGDDLEIISESGQNTYVFGGSEDKSIDLNQSHYNIVFGNEADNEIIGSAGSDWLVGGPGRDKISGGGGDDFIVVDGDDVMGDIDGGDGIDVIQAIGSTGVLMVLSELNAEVAIGTAHGDVIYARGGVNYFVRGGAGSDILIGGSVSDALSGESGDDYIEGGSGNDLLRGHAGNDTLLGGADDDIIYGGGGNDTLKGGSGNDVFFGESGDDFIDGGAGTDIAIFSGKLREYAITLVDGRIAVSDRVAGRDGVSFLHGVEKIGFDDVTSLQLDIENPIPNADKIFVGNIGTWTIAASDILQNDLDFQGDTVSISAIADSQGGTATLDAGGNVVFTPDPNFVGQRWFKYQIVDSQGNGAAAASVAGSDTSAEALGVVYLVEDGQAVDPLFPEQWYLTEINVIEAWKDYTGKGVQVEVLEAGMFDYEHPELSGNAAAFVQSGSADPDAINKHATNVAGVLAAARNDQGIVGVAYEADLFGANITEDGLAGAMDLQRLGDRLADLPNYDVVNNSWSWRPPFSDNFNNVSGLELELERAAAFGRDGLGTVLVFGGGNERDSGGNANDSAILASRTTVVVGGINKIADLGVLEITEPAFSNPGANILVSAPASNILTTGTSVTNSNGTQFGSDFNSAEGTSFATPIVSGVVALMLEANPSLGWRDVQEILAYSANEVSDDNSVQTFNGATTWNGGGLRLEEAHDYGFGQIDALAAVRLAETWIKTQTYDNELNGSLQSGSIDLAIPDGGVVEQFLNFDVGFEVENAQVTLDIAHEQLGDLTILLVSPDGTESVLLDRYGKAPGSDATDRGYGSFDTSFEFGSVRHWGEEAYGTWTLRIEDNSTGGAGTLRSWGLTLFGDLALGNDTYVYTNEFAMLDTVGRETLSDPGGVDTINATAVTPDSRIDLSSGASSSIAGRTLTIAAGTVIENAFAGDGDDWIVGNSTANRLWGGRGDDSMAGGADNDVLFGGAGTDTLAGGGGADLFVVDKAQGEVDSIVDFDVTLDTLMLTGFGSAFAFADLVLMQNGANVEIELPDGQRIILHGVLAGVLTADMVTFRDSFGAADPWYGARDDVTIRGGEQDDILQGSSEFDILVAGAGNDVLVGGEGGDIFIIEVDPGSADVIQDFDPSESAERIVLSGFSELSSYYQIATEDTADGLRLQLPNGQSVLLAGVSAAAFDEDDVVLGDGSINFATRVLTGSDDDYLAHTDPTEPLVAFTEAGDDTAFGDVAIDFISGGPGNDTLVGENSSAHTTGSGDLIYGDGGDDILRGSAEGDRLFGGRGSDEVRGDAGNDELHGGADWDSLFGGEGDDTLFLEKDDILYGGPGSDTFVILPGAGVSLSFTGDSVWMNYIDDFAPEDPDERIDIRALKSILSVEDFQFSSIVIGQTTIKRLSFTDHNVAVGFGGGVDPETLDASQFIFNTAPVAVADAFAMDEDSVLVVSVEDLVGNDIDAEADELKVLSVDGTANGTAELVDGQIVFTPDANFHGTASFTYTISDSVHGVGAESQATVTISVAAQNDAPTLVEAPTEQVATQDVAFSYVLPTNMFADVDGDLVTVSAELASGEALPSWLSFNGSTFNGTPTNSDIGTIVVRVVGTDPTGAEASGEFLLTIENVNDAPVVADGLDNQSVRVIEALDYTIPFSAFADPDPGDSLTYVATLSDGSTLPTWIVFSDGNFSGVPGETDRGTVAIDVQATDSAGATATASFALTVVNAPDQTIVGTADADNLLGGSGNDTIQGADGGDVLDGFEGNDVLLGGGGTDTLIGGEGSDTASYSGAAGAVTASLATGQATDDGDGATDTLTSIENLIGSAYADSLTGDAGNNVLSGGGGADNLDGGGGTDTANYSGAAASVTANLAAGQATDDGDGATDAFTSIENLIGSSHDDTLTGDAGINVLSGGAGADVLRGGGGADELDGGDGTDTVSYSTAAAGVTASLAAGQAADDGDGATDSLTSIENLIGSAYADTLIGDAGANVLSGGGGADDLDGGGGTDTASYSAAAAGVTANLVVGQATDDGDGGTDTFTSIENLTGSAHDDALDGDAGINVIRGGAGGDTLRGGGGADDLDGGEGTDTATYGAAAGAVTASLATGQAIDDGDGATDTLTSIENLIGSAHDDALTGDAGINVLSGGAGADTLRGGGGTDTLIGGEGSDTASYSGAAGGVTASLAAGQATDDGDGATDTFTSIENLIGSAHDDTLTGDAGINTLIGGAGADALSGDGGDDDLRGGAGTDVLDGGDGTDAANYAAATAGVTASLAAGQASDDGDGATDNFTSIENLIGSSHDDTLTGDAGINVLSGGAGADVLRGGGGADELDGGDGTDTVSYSTAAAGVTASLAAGQAADDGDGATDSLTSIENLIGSAYADTLIGDAGANVLSGGGGADDLDGGGGTDTASYSAAAAGVTANLVVGQATDDGDGGTDTFTSIENLTGSAHDDALDGDAGINVIRGGAGGDTLRGGGGADDLDGGEGTDTATYGAAAGAVTASLATGQAIDDGDGATDTLTSIENLIGSAHDDALTGDAGINVLSGGAGADTLRGGGGTDTLIGGEGSDTASYSGAAGGVTASLAAGQATDDGDGATDTFTSIENLIGSAHDDTLTGDAGINTLIGGAGADALSGDGGDDDLRGGAGTDVLDGGDGTDAANYAAATAGVTASLAAGQASDDGDGATDNFTSIENLIGSAHDDTLTGDSGANVLLGGAGSDTLSGGGGLDVLNGGAGTDAANYAAAAAGVTASLAAGHASDDGDGGSDTLSLIENLIGSAHDDTLTGDSGINILTGASGNDALFGGAGNDTLYGEADNDDLVGGAGDDTAYGGAGADTLWAGEGSDQLWGGADRDRFVFKLWTERGDTIHDFELAGADHDVIEIGEMLANLGYIGSDPFGDGWVRVSAAGGDSKVEIDADGGGDAFDDLALVLGVDLTTVSVGDYIDVGAFVPRAATPNDDVLYGTSGNDTINGLAGNDAIFGVGGNDVLYGGAGADALDGGAGSDTAHYGSSAAGVSVSLLDGTTAGGDAAGDTLANIENVHGSGYNDTLVGDSQANALTGASGNDALFGGAGNDTLYGEADNDDLVGGAGDDTAYGGAGADTLWAGEGSDQLWGGADRDRFVFKLWTERGDTIHDFELAGADHDVIEIGEMLANLGYIGSDPFGDGWVRVSAAGGDSKVEIDADGGGDAFDDLALVLGVDLTTVSVGDYIDVGAFVPRAATPNDDVLYGTSGNDTINGLAGNDAIFGVGGNDVLYGGAGADALDGGAGSDTAHYGSSAAGVSVSLLDGTTAGGDAAGDTLANIENVHGSGYNDTLVGDSQANALTGASGNDALFGGAGNDTLYGEADNDDLVGGAGDDTAYGGAGADTLWAGEGSDQLWGGADRDRFVFKLWTERGDTIHDFELAGADHDVIEIGEMLANLGYIGSDPFGDGWVRVSAAGGDSKVEIDADGGGDAFDDLALVLGVDLTTVSVGDYIDVGAFVPRAATPNDDVLYGTSGNDTINGLAGNDAIFGVGGNDVLYGGAGADALDGGAGSDTAHYGSSAAGVSVSLLDGTTAGGDAAGDTLANIENVHGSGYNDTLVGDSQANALTGASGNDALFGGAGNDTLYGEADNDDLVGGAGDDTAYGGAGADTLWAGEGSDQLWGGADRDRFVFKLWTERGDTIHDFELAGADHDVIEIGEMLANLGYIGSDPFGDGWVRVSAAGGDSKVEIDADGGGDAFDDLALVLGVDLTAVDTSDYLLI